MHSSVLRDAYGEDLWRAVGEIVMNFFDSKHAGIDDEGGEEDLDKDYG